MARHITLALVIVGLCAGIGMIVYYGHRIARTESCAGNLTSIALALHQYHTVYGTFPPAIVRAGDGRVMHSWRAMLLPIIDEQLAKQYDYTVPWNDPRNQIVHDRMPMYLRCPNYNSGHQRNHTNYVAVVGNGTTLRDTSSVSLADVQVSTSEVIMIVETTSATVHWLEPRDVSIDQVIGVGPDGSTIMSSDDCVGAAVVYANGTIARLPSNTNLSLFRFTFGAERRVRN